MPLTESSQFSSFRRIDENGVCIKDILHAERVLFLNLVNRISLTSCNEDEPSDMVSLSFDENSYEEQHAASTLLHFTKFSPYINGEELCCALVGVKAKNNDYTYLPNFLVVQAKCIEDMYGDQTYKLSWYSIFGKQTLTTYTGVTFSTEHDSNPRLATVSDDRSIQILTPSEENRDPVLHPGSYDGIHYIDIIDERKMLIATYDGAVSLWTKSKNGVWRYWDVFHIHSDWVWKVKHFYRGETLYFVSCSYDGTVKVVNVQTGDEETLIDVGRKHTRQPVLDFAIGLNAKHEIQFLVALTANRLYWYFSSSSIRNEEPRWKNQSDEYNYRSVAMLGIDKPYVAVKSSNGCQILTLSNERFKPIIDMEPVCGFIRTIKLFEKDQFSSDRLMIVSGNRTAESGNKKIFYIAIYLEEHNQWVYHGSIFPASNISYAVDFVCDDKLTNVQAIQNYGEVNDFCIKPLVLNEGLAHFALSIAHKDSRISNFEVSIGERKTVFWHKFTMNVASQPMSITYSGDDLLVGLLNGEAVILNTLAQTTTSFRTYANLNASVSIKLKKVKYSDNEQENQKIQEKFRNHFAGYFGFC